MTLLEGKPSFRSLDYDERTTVKELYNNLASRPNSEDLAGHSVDEISVDEIRVGSCKDSLDIVGDSSK